jgi:hypothetical protein
MNNYTINEFSVGVHPQKHCTTVSFIASSVDQFRNEIIQWGKETGCFYQSHKIDGKQWNTFLGDFIGQPTKAVVLPTKSQWCAFILNDSISGIPTSTLSSIAQRLKTQCVGITYDDQVEAKEQDRPFGLVFRYYNGRISPIHKRMIYLSKDYGKWDFSQDGEPLPFENVESYQAKKKSERFTKEMIFSYALQLGIRLDNPQEFYLPQNAIGLTWQYSKSDNKIDEIAQQIANEFGMKLTILKPNK